MGYQLDYRNESDSLFITCIGKIEDLPEWKRQILEMSAITRSQSCTKIQLDYTQLEFPDQMKTHIQFVRWVKTENAIPMDGIRSAIVIRKLNFAIEIFNQLHALKRNLTLKVFEDSEKALVWLKRED